MIGKNLAHYEVTALLGKGGMGEVYRARDLNLGRDVALKLLPEAGSRDGREVSRFEREAKALASLEHPNIVAVHGLHQDQELHLIAMALVEGETLAASVVDGGLSLGRLLDVGIPLADAVAFAHGKGVIHRDLKPGNVMLDTSSRVRILDFGVAALRQSRTDTEADETLEALTREGEIVGTVAYMAPEQLVGASVDARADVFSIGVLLYELATGRRPFEAESTAGMASAILRDAPTPLEELRPDLPADLARVIRRCLEKEPARRIQTARDIANEFEELRLGIRTAPDAPSAGGLDGPRQLVEGRMKLTIEHVRALSEQIPSMVGDTMTYLDNERDSDVLVAYLHGIGGDQREFADVLSATACRAVATSLYGFGPAARNRHALSLADHNRLLVFLLEDLRRLIGPRHMVLVGHSAGADQILQIMASPESDRVRPDGLVLLGPTVLASAGGVTGPYAKMTEDPGDVMSAVQAIAAIGKDLETWIRIHDYLLLAVRKFGTDTRALRRFARDIVASYEDDRFFEMFRLALEKVQHVRCVFGADDGQHADRAVEKQITDNALGGRYSEEMIATVGAMHIELKSASVTRSVVTGVVESLTG